MKFGQRVKDKLTGIEGTFAGKVEYESGLKRYYICLDNDPEQNFAGWVDADRVVLVKGKKNGK